MRYIKNFKEDTISSSPPILYDPSAIEFINFITGKEALGIMFEDGSFMVWNSDISYHEFAKKCTKNLPNWIKRKFFKKYVYIIINNNMQVSLHKDNTLITGVTDMRDKFTRKHHMYFLKF